jgi:hypothetical protein
MTKRLAPSDWLAAFAASSLLAIFAFWATVHAMM